MEMHLEEVLEEEGGHGGGLGQATRGTEFEAGGQSRRRRS